MSSDLFVPLFDSSYFDRLLTRTNISFLPIWESIREEISNVLAQLHSELLFRVNQHMYFTLPYMPTPPRRIVGELDENFERRKHSFFNWYYMEVCDQLEFVLDSMRRSVDIMKYPCRLYPLANEVERLRSVLFVIAHIVHSPVVQAPPPVRLVSITYEDDTVEHISRQESERTSSVSSSDRKSPKLQQEKILLELKKDRVKSSSISSSTSIDYSASSESQFSDDESALDKKEEFISTDDEDFDAYSEEILKLTTTTGSALSSSASKVSASPFPSVASLEECTLAIIKEMNLDIAADVFSFLDTITN